VHPNVGHIKVSSLKPSATILSHALYGQFQKGDRHVPRQYSIATLHEIILSIVSLKA
jgi:hypothetical protein